MTAGSGPRSRNSKQRRTKKRRRQHISSPRAGRGEPTIHPEPGPAKAGEEMPKKLERQLKKQAKKKGFKGERADRYVYGTLRKTGWKPKKEK